MLNFTETLEPLKIQRLLSRSIPYYLKSWHDYDEESGLFGSIDPAGFNMRSVGSSSPVIEYVIRPHVNICCILGSFLFLDQCDLLSAIISRDEMISRLRKGVRWACDTHLTGSRDVETFLERKRWGENWRSSLWATLLGVCGFFCRAVFDDDLLGRIGRVLAFEANRFIGVMPPGGCAIDTKLEENALDAMVLAWAINLCPDNPNVEKWDHTLQLWSVNISSSIQDCADHSPYLGNSLALAVTTQNLFPDMTAENHGFFHPDILTYGSWIVLAIAAYAFHKQLPPKYLFRKSHHRTFDLLLRFCLPNGLIYAPGSHDLPMFIPQPLSFAWGLLSNNARAKTLTARLLSWMDSCLLTTQENEGPWVLGLEQYHDGWNLLFQSNVGLELALLASLPLSEKTPPTGVTAQIENIAEARHIYPFVEVCYRRNFRTTRSVAWKALSDHPVIGFAVHSQPELLVPVKANLLGIPQVSDHVHSWEVAFHIDRLLREGFDTYGLLRYFNVAGTPVLHRHVRAQTWGDEGMIVFDEIIADVPVVVFEQYLSPIYFVNDLWTGDSLDFYSGSLREIFRSSERTFREVQCPSFWASIGTHFLFQLIWGRTKGLYYVPGGERNAPPLWKNCRLDTLGIHVESREAAAGEAIYRVGFYVGTGKGPRSFKSAGTAGEFFKGLVIMDGKFTAGLD